MIFVSKYSLGLNILIPVRLAVLYEDVLVTASAHCIPVEELEMKYPVLIIIMPIKIFTIDISSIPVSGDVQSCSTCMTASALKVVGSSGVLTGVTMTSFWFDPVITLAPAKDSNTIVIEEEAGIDHPFSASHVISWELPIVAIVT